MAYFTGRGAARCEKGVPVDIQEPLPLAPEEQVERLSRRRLLHLGTLIGLGALAALTACGGGDDDDDDDEDDD